MQLACRAGVCGGNVRMFAQSPQVVVARLDRATQYAAALVIRPSHRGVLGPPLSRRTMACSDALFGHSSPPTRSHAFAGMIVPFVFRSRPRGGITGP